MFKQKEIIENEQAWKVPRDVGKAIDHEYEEDSKTLSMPIAEMMNLVVPLGEIHSRAEKHCQAKLGVKTHKQSGFTLVELITVMVIVGIIAVAALPKFFDKNIFDARGFHDQVISTVRYAQKVAIAQHRFVCVDTTTVPNTISLSQGATNACGTPLASLSGAGNYSIPAPGGVTLGATTLSFDALGKPSAMRCITVSGNNTIKVEAETGFVHSVAVCP